MTVPVAITVVVVLIYFAIMLLLAGGLARMKQSGKPGGERSERLTVIVPFRNEYRVLPHLVDDLLKQSCGAERFEAVFVDDHSDDGSGRAIESLVQEHPHLSYAALPEDKYGKKAALAHGINLAGSSWILQLDADCRIGQRFIASRLSFLKNHRHALVGGLVTTGAGSGGLVEGLERLDLLGLAAAGAGSFYYGRPLMCSGANLLYSKELWMKTRHMDPSARVPSGDDMFLMIAARKLGEGLGYDTDPDSVVRTTPSGNPAGMVKQRARWGSKSMYYRMPDIQAMALLVLFTYLLIALFPVWLVMNPRMWLVFAVLLALKSLADFAILYIVTGITRQRRTLLLFIPAAALHYILYLAVIIRSLAGPAGWKGRN